MKILSILVVTAAVAWGQGNASMRARELFYTPPPDAAKPTVVATPAPAGSDKNNPPPVAKAAEQKTAPKVVAAKATPKKSLPAKAVPGATEHVETVAEKPALAAVPLGLRYSVLKRDSAGKFAEVNPDSTFHSGDRIRIQVEANTTGHLYVVAQGSSGNWQVLFPSREVASGSNQVHRGETRQIPAGDRGQFVFDEQAGAEKVFVVLSRQPEQNLDQLIYTMKKQDKAEPERVMMAQATVGDDVISRIRGQMMARDLVFEKVENETVSQNTSFNPGANNGAVRMETAAYVVNPSTAADARLVVDLSLKHQ